MVICAQYDRSKLELVLNGVSQGTHSYGAGVANTDVPLIIGEFNGDIAEVIYYDRILANPEKTAVNACLSLKYNIPIPLVPVLQYSETWEPVTRSKILKYEESWDVIVFTQVVDEDWEA